MTVNKKRAANWYKAKGLHRITVDIPDKYWKALQRKRKGKQMRSIQKVLVSLIEQDYALEKRRGK